MFDSYRNVLQFQVAGRYALFTDPLTKMGGERWSYAVPTYEALKGIAKSIYWKPTFVWHIDAVRLMTRIQTQTKGMRPLEFAGGNTLAIYTYLADVQYQVHAHFEWNEHRTELRQDRIDGKHYAIARRMLECGGRQDIFLGTRDCQGYVEPCAFGSSKSPFDGTGELPLGFMFHGFDYPDEMGGDELHARFWTAAMVDGVIQYPRPEQCPTRKFIRKTTVKPFGTGRNIKPAEDEFEALQ